MLKRKKIGKDFLLNLVAALLVLAATEFVVLPHLAAVMDPDAYGSILMLIGVITTISSAAGNGLNNVRLILHHKYEEEHLSGDYNILLSFIGGAILLAGGLVGCFLRLDIYGTVMLTMLSLLGFLRLYLSVFFRLQLNYVGILLMNLLLSGGYVLMLWILSGKEMLSTQWWWIFLLAEMATLLYLLKSTTILQESWKRTPLFPVICRNFGWLCYLTLLGSLLNYMDRNLLLPLLGGEAVALIFVAMMTGKTISFLAKPMGNVMLSYFAQQNFVMTRKRYWTINAYTCLVGVVCYVVSVLSAKWVLLYLYPGYVDAASKYIMLASAIPVLVMVGALAQPAVLRYSPLFNLSAWQTGYMFVHVVVSCLMIQWKELFGFCYSAISLGLLRLILLWQLGDMYMQKQN